MPQPNPPRYEWKKTFPKFNLYFTNDSTLYNHAFMRAAFDSPDMPWASPMNDDAWETMLQNSCMIGLYKLASNEQQHEIDREKPEMVGMSRLLTDYVTFAWITDVYLSPELRGFGAGKWMAQCIHDLFKGLPAFRRAGLITQDGSSNVMLYERHLGMKVHRPEDEGYVFMLTDQERR